ncbi:unnamed protein product [Miscanthus lutarioriparius]|uniref:Peptidase M20 dimerisation domain-containing protein n=1 Tax=Miscanthus lutarioriparius TaxID=422564 RepID=A0A811MPA6_9POAL|nr:unnamed protein product [Miscanthus lutarioriparius]
MEEKMRPYPATVNDEAMYSHAKAVAESMLGEANVKVRPQVMAAEDFGFNAQKIPAAFFSVGVRDEGTGKVHHVHSPHLQIDEGALPIGAAFHAAVAMEYLNKHELVEWEFKSKTGRCTPVAMMLTWQCYSELLGCYSLGGTFSRPSSPCTWTPPCRWAPSAPGQARFTATITGKGGHAAGPQHVVDPIVAASSAVLGLQQLVARATDPLQGAVVSVTFIRGGEAFNVIPESVTLGGTCRSMTTEGLSYLMKRIREVVEGQAAVGWCTAAVDFMEEKMRPYPATVNDELVYGHAKAVAKSMIGEANRIPAAFFSVGVRNAETGKIHHVHSPHLDIDEAALPIGAALHTAVAIEYLNKQASAPRPSCS